MSEPIISSEPGPWANRFRDLPRFPTPPGVLAPEFDGDMAELHELRDRIYAAVADGAEVPVGPHFGEIHHDVVRAFAIDNSLFFPTINPWPRDHAAQLLAAWRTDRADRGVAA
jgi:hypothetical protein